MNIVTRYSIKRATAILFIFYISFLNNSVVSDAYAIIFNNGIPNVYVDVNTPNETYFGGGNGVDTSSTSLTFIVQNLEHNTVEDIVGGGLSINQQPNLVINSTSLNINNTHGRNVIGGSMDNGAMSAPMVITNSIDVNINNSRFNNVYGGHLDGHGLIDGRINLNIDSSIIANEVVVSGIYSTPRNAGLSKADMFLNIKNSQINNLYAVKTNGLLAISGSFYANILGTQINNITLYDTGTCFYMGNTYIYIAEKSKINMFKLIDNNAAAVMEHYITVNDADMQTIDLTSDGNIKTDFTLQKGSIGTFIINTPDLKKLIVNINDGFINTMHIGSTNIVQNNIGNLNFTMTGGMINTINIGNNLTTIKELNACISAGTINTLNIANQGIELFTLRFIPGGISTIKEFPVCSVTQVKIERGAKTCWGNGETPFELRSQFFTWEGELQVPGSSSVVINMRDGLFTADGGTLSPVKLKPNTRTPLLYIKDNTTMLELGKPINVNMDFSPECLNASNIPLVVVSNSFANPNLFTSKNRKGLIWSNVDFDYETNTWYLTKVQMSKDYYAYSAAREASNWLRQKSISTALNFSYNALINKREGFWFNAQGGYEDIDVAVGSSKMPWSMANLGYNYRHDFSTDFTTNCGLAFGYAQGWHRWNLANRVKNDISIGMLDGYAGVSHSSGLYGLLTAQIAISKIKTKNPGFSTNTNWKETVPTGAVELGWNCPLESGVTITPRAQLIVERLSKHDFKLSYDAGHDTVTLKKNTTLTSVIGLVGNYEYTLWSMPFDVQASIDWIKGITGDYASHSKFFNTTFKDKNDSDVVRVSLGANTYVLENLSVGCQIFGDLGNDRGVGGQLNATYKF